jgi:putative copper export protein
MIDGAGGMLAIMLRFAALIATTGALGAWAFGRFVVRHVSLDADDALRQTVRRAAIRSGACCFAVLALTAVARLFGPVAAVPGATSDIPLSAALATGWGKALLVQGIASATALVALVARREAASWPAATQAGLIVAAVIPPYLAHAGMSVDFRALSVVIDVIHGVAAGAWVGALALLAMAVASGRRAAEGPSRTARLIIAFHPVAVIAAPVVFVTGLITAWLRMGAPVGIATPTYSGLFVAKLVLVGVTGFVGAGHAKLATRRVSSVAYGAVGRTLAAECLLAVVVLVITAVLVGTAPIG